VVVVVVVVVVVCGGGCLPQHLPGHEIRTCTE